MSKLKKKKVKSLVKTVILSLPVHREEKGDKPRNEFLLSVPFVELYVQLDSFMTERIQQNIRLKCLIIALLFSAQTHRVFAHFEDHFGDLRFAHQIERFHEDDCAQMGVHLQIHLFSSRIPPFPLTVTSSTARFLFLDKTPEFFKSMSRVFFDNSLRVSSREILS